MKNTLLLIAACTFLFSFESCKKDKIDDSVIENPTDSIVKNTHRIKYIYTINGVDTVAKAEYEYNGEKISKYSFSNTFGTEELTPYIKIEYAYNGDSATLSTFLFEQQNFRNTGYYTYVFDKKKIKEDFSYSTTGMVAGFTGKREFIYTGNELTRILYYVYPSGIKTISSVMEFTYTDGNPTEGIYSKIEEDGSEINLFRKTYNYSENSLSELIQQSKDTTDNWVPEGLNKYENASPTEFNDTYFNWSVSNQDWTEYFTIQYLYNSEGYLIKISDLNIPMNYTSYVYEEGNGNYEQFISPDNFTSNKTSPKSAGETKDFFPKISLKR